MFRLNETSQFTHIPLPGVHASFESSTPHTPKTPESSSFPTTPRTNEKTALLSPTNEQYRAETKVTPMLQKLTPSKVSISKHLESDSDSSEYEDPNVEYVNLRMKLLSVRLRQNEESNDELVGRLESRLADVKKSYLFSQKHAEAAFRAKRREVGDAILFPRLREEVPPVQTSKTDTKEHVEAEKIAESSAEFSAVNRSSENVFDGEGNDEEPGGLLALLEPMPANETTTSGSIITVREMTSPKQWAGRTPKTLLSEFVTKTDRYAVISYTDISGASRVKRASLVIRWTGGRNNSWVMEDVACHDLVQAEQYVATIALHNLTYPRTEGFQSSSGNPNGVQTSYRHLPPSFRELWNELEEKRKEEEEKTHREIWASLTSILDEKFTDSGKVSARISREFYKSPTWS